MNLIAAIHRLDNTVVSVNELDRYFGTKSLDELLQKLRQLAWDGYFELEVTLSTEYFAWQSSHRDLIYGNDIIPPFDYAYRSLRERDTHGLSISSVKPLTDEQISEVLQKLPANLANQYLRFKLWDVNSESLLELITSQQNIRGADPDEFYDRVEHNGLVADGSDITYKGKQVILGFQHRQVLRMLLEKKGKLCTKDEFTGNPDIFTDDSYPNIKATLRKLISALRTELKPTVGINCIKNTPS